MNAKQILILKSSPRKRANSSILADQVAAGARDAGADGRELRPAQPEHPPLRRAATSARERRSA